jgi:hypothetical protein
VSTAAKTSSAIDGAPYLRAVPTGSRGVITRAMAGTASPRGAIKAKCLDCCHFDRAEVAACSVWLCPLHPYRPFQKAQQGSESASVGEISGTTRCGGTTASIDAGNDAKARFPNDPCREAA